MVTTTYRPLTENERKELEKSIQFFQEPFTTLLAWQYMRYLFPINILVGCFLGLLPALILLHFAPTRPYALPSWGIFAILFAVFRSVEYLLILKQERVNALARDIRRLERGEKEIVHYVVFQFVEVSLPEVAFCQSRWRPLHCYYEDVLCDLGNGEAVLLAIDNEELIDAEEKYKDSSPVDIPQQWELNWVGWPGESEGYLQKFQQLPYVSRRVYWRDKQAFQQLQHGDVLSGVSFDTLEQDFPHFFRSGHVK